MHVLFGTVFYVLQLPPVIRLTQQTCVALVDLRLRFNINWIERKTFSYLVMVSGCAHWLISELNISSPNCVHY